jgi:hypothetical protein
VPPRFGASARCLLLSAGLTARQMLRSGITGGRYHICRIMTLDLTDDEKAALARLLRSTIDDARYPHSARLVTLRAICTARKGLRPRNSTSRAGCDGAHRARPFYDRNVGADEPL